jgi:hypothetical protein
MDEGWDKIGIFSGMSVKKRQDEKKRGSRMRERKRNRWGNGRKKRRPAILDILCPVFPSTLYEI